MGINTTVNKFWQVIGIIILLIGAFHNSVPVALVGGFAVLSSQLSIIEELIK